MSSRQLRRRPKPQGNKGAYQIREAQNGKVNIITRFGEMGVSFHYPDENPQDAIQQIATCLNYIGTFEGIKKNKH